MVRIKDVYDYLDSVAPFATQADFDNSGFLVGDPERYVQHIGVVLDITSQTLNQARRLGVDLIVSHHPVIFEAKKSFTAKDMAFELASAGIAAICAHTSLDAAPGGVNDVLAQLLGVKKVEPFPTAEYPSGLVRVGFLPFSSGAELAEFVGDTLFSEVRYYDAGRAIETVAICGGNGGSLTEEIAEAGIDAFITGECTYHRFLEAAEKSMTVIAAGHFETENPVVEALAAKLKVKFLNAEVSVLEQDLITDVYLPDLLR